MKNLPQVGSVIRYGLCWGRVMRLGFSAILVRNLYTGTQEWWPLAQIGEG